MTRIEENILISQLLWKYLNDDLSVIEQKELDELFKNDPSLKTWIEECMTQEHIEKRLEEHYSINLSDKWETFNTNRKRGKYNIKKMSLLMLRVAAVLLPVAIATYFLMESSWNPSLKMSQNIIIPGTSKATLTLSSGEIVQLEVNQSDTLYDAGTKIKSTGTRLEYSLGNDIPKQKKYETNTLNIPHGGEFQLILPDGTKVWVNSESSLKYQVPFGEINRDIELIGEAYFEVAHNPELQFRVKTKDGLVKVVGTCFNVRAYPSEAKNITTLANGSIALKLGEKEGLILKSGEQAVFTEVNQDITVSNVDVNRFVAWKNGQYMFVDDRLEDIFEDLARWYNIEVFYESEAAKELIFTCYIGRDKGINKILELIQKTRRVKFEIINNSISVKLI